MSSTSSPTVRQTGGIELFKAGRKSQVNSINPLEAVSPWSGIQQTAVSEDAPEVVPAEVEAEGEKPTGPPRSNTFKKKIGFSFGILLICGLGVGAYFQFARPATATKPLHSNQAGEHKTPIHDTTTLAAISTARIERKHANMARCDAGFPCWKTEWHNATHVHRKLMDTSKVKKERKLEWMKTGHDDKYSHLKYNHFSSAAVTTLKDENGEASHDLSFHVLHDLPFGQFRDVNGELGFRSLRMKIHNKKTGEKCHVVPFGLSFQHDMSDKKYRSPEFYYFSVEPTDAARRSTFVSLKKNRVTTTGGDLLKEWHDNVRKVVREYRAADPNFKGTTIGDVVFAEAKMYSQSDAMSTVNDTVKQFNDYGRKLFARRKSDDSGYGYGDSGGYSSGYSGDSGGYSSETGSSGGYSGSSGGYSGDSGSTGGYSGGSDAGDSGTCSQSQTIGASNNWYSCSGCNGCSTCGSSCCCPDGMYAISGAPYCQTCETTSTTGSGSSMGLGNDVSSSNSGGFCSEIKSMLPSACTANAGCTQIVCSGPAELASYITFALTGTFDLCHTPMAVSASATVNGQSVWSKSIDIDGGHYLPIPDTTFGVPEFYTMSLFADVDIEGDLTNLQVNTGIEGGGSTYEYPDWKCKDWPSYCLDALPLWLMKGTYSLSGFCYGT